MEASKVKIANVIKDFKVHKGIEKYVIYEAGQRIIIYDKSYAFKEAIDDKNRDGIIDITLCDEEKLSNHIQYDEFTTNTAQRIISDYDINSKDTKSIYNGIIIFSIIELIVSMFIVFFSTLAIHIKLFDLLLTIVCSGLCVGIYTVISKMNHRCELAKRVKSLIIGDYYE